MNDSPIRNAPSLLKASFFDTNSQQIAGLIKRLYRDPNLPARSEETADILEELTSYAFDTLPREERALASSGIAVSPAHADEHLCFQEYIANHCLQASRGVSSSKELLYFLVGWWHEHVLGTDLAEMPAATTGAAFPSVKSEEKRYAKNPPSI